MDSVVYLFNGFYFRLISVLYIQAGDIDRYYKKCVANPLTIEKISDGGLNQVNYLFSFALKWANNEVKSNRP